MHLRSLKKTRKDVSLHDPIGTDKEGNEIELIDILGTEADDVVDKVQLKIEKSKIYRNLDILELLVLFFCCKCNKVRVN
ncbi:hypothetical protein PAECIP111802_06903 [Paenibacillus allorhizosphaerae]|uniref:Uncharacterized protein n=1 Tax=Paenibacillus allorhizosphaerae TaxID=2849866 RepID=A0ABN7U0E5_9BACL|nr:hypothetical protein PAECIP111802_06903 [Paenibacillus allorhizosphaerae]